MFTGECEIFAAQNVMITHYYGNIPLDHHSQTHLYVKLHLLVPVLLGDAVETVKHDRKDDVRIFFNQTNNVLIVPEVKCTLSDLKTRTHRPHDQHI